MPDPKWLQWARQLAALSQNGLTYSDNPYEIERYEAIRRIAAEMMAECSDLPIDEWVQLFTRESGYATPKVDVRGVCFRDDKILLVRERIDNGWTLPGGWADPCQSPSEAVAREIFEESGFTARALRLLAVYDRSKHPHKPPMPFHLYKMFFLCEITGGEPTTSWETTAVDFFDVHDLPGLSTSRVLPYQIQRMHQMLHDPTIPTDFD